MSTPAGRARWSSLSRPLVLISTSSIHENRPVVELVETPGPDLDKLDQRPGPISTGSINDPT
jgi:hypothetical protein